MSFLPEGNLAACWAYVCALIGLIPGLGLVFGLPAIVFGTIGRRTALRHPERPGLGHAYVSRLVGAVELVCSVGGLLCLGKANGWL